MEDPSIEPVNLTTTTASSPSAKSDQQQEEQQQQQEQTTLPSSNFTNADINDNTSSPVKTFDNDQSSPPMKAEDPSFESSPVSRQPSQSQQQQESQSPTQNVTTDDQQSREQQQEQMNNTQEEKPAVEEEGEEGSKPEQQQNAVADEVNNNSEEQKEEATKADQQQEQQQPAVTFATASLSSTTEPRQNTLKDDLAKLNLANYYKPLSELLLPEKRNNSNKSNKTNNKKSASSTNDNNSDDDQQQQQQQQDAPDPGDTPRGDNKTKEQKQSELDQRKIQTLADLSRIPASHWEMYVPIKKHRDVIRAYLYAEGKQQTNTNNKSRRGGSSSSNNLSKRSAISSVMQSIGRLDHLVEQKVGMARTKYNKTTNMRLNKKGSINTLGLEGETQNMNGDEASIVKNRIRRVVQELDEAKSRLVAGMEKLQHDNKNGDNDDNDAPARDPQLVASRLRTRPSSSSSTTNRNQRQGNISNNNYNNRSKIQTPNSTNKKKSHKDNNDDNGDDDDGDDDELLMMKTPFPRQAFVCRPSSDKPHFGAFSKAAQAIQVEKNFKYQQKRQEIGANSNNNVVQLPDGTRVLKMTSVVDKKVDKTDDQKKQPEPNQEHQQQQENKTDAEVDGATTSNQQQPENKTNDSTTGNPEATPVPQQQQQQPFSPTPPPQHRPSSAAAGGAFAYAKFSVFKADFEHASRAPIISSSSLGNPPVANSPRVHRSRMERPQSGKELARHSPYRRGRSPPRNHSKPHPLHDHDLFLGSGNYPNCSDEGHHFSSHGGGPEDLSSSSHHLDPDVEDLLMKTREKELQRLKMKSASAKPFYRKFPSASASAATKDGDASGKKKTKKTGGTKTSYFNATAFTSINISSSQQQQQQAANNNNNNNNNPSRSQINTNHQEEATSPRPMSAAEAQSTPIPASSTAPIPPNIKKAYRSPSPAFWGCTGEEDETLNSNRRFVLRGVGGRQ